MKSKIFKTLGIVTSVAMLGAMLTVIPVLALSSATVTLTDYDISATAGYTVTFYLDEELPLAGSDTITITLPSDTTLVKATVEANASIQASPGWFSAGGWDDAIVTGVGFTADATARTITATLSATDKIGEGAQVRIKVTDGISNPSTAGDYTLSVKTSEETTAIPSAAYTITVPSFDPLPGVIKVYNASGVLVYMDQGPNILEDVITSHVAEDYTVELGTGLYKEDDIAVATEGLTIKAAGAVADTIVPARFTVSAAEVTFEGLTLKSDVVSGTAITIAAAGDEFTIDGCAFEKFGTATTTAAETFVSVANTTTAGTIKDCTFTSTLGAVKDTCVSVASTAIDVTIQDSTFNLDNTGTTADDDVGISVASDAAIEGNTFNGAGGVAINHSAGTGKVVTVDDNTIKDCTRAFYQTGMGKLDFTNNTVSGCGQATGAVYTAGASPLFIYVSGGTTIVQNTITGCKSVIVYAHTNTAAGATHVNFNNLSGNTLGIMHYVGAAYTAQIDATRNWWGTAAGPTSTQIAYYTDPDLGVDASYPLGAAPSNGKIAIGTASLSAKTTAGVVVSLLDDGAAAVPSTTGIIGIATYSANPAAVDVPSALTDVKYIDVFVTDAGTAADTVRIMIYGSVTANTQVWFYSDFAGEWVKCSNVSTNTTSGFMVVDITVYTTPAILDLLGLPFIVVEAPPAAPGSATITQSPALGAMDVAINTSFTWPTVAGAVKYEIEIAKESGQTAENKFYLPDFIGSSTVNAYKPADNLLYDTQYWWRVRGINDAGAAGSWTTAFFTTEEAPPEEPEPTPPVEIVQGEAPVITLEIPPAEEVQVIPDYLLWLVIAIGAVLVVAVIVLIVRTRRIS